MKIIAAILFVTSLFAFTSASTDWITDFETAKTTAKTGNKKILMSFQGSDWCNNCMRLEKTLFESEDFKSFAEKNLVLLKLDFPARKKNKLSDEQTAHNDKMAEQFNKKGTFPTVLILDAEGKMVGELKTPQNTVEAYMAELKMLVK